MTPSLKTKIIEVCHIKIGQKGTQVGLSFFCKSFLPLALPLLPSSPRGAWPRGFEEKQTYTYSVLGFP